MSRRIAALAFIIAFATPAPALAKHSTGRLSMAAAERAITLYEQNYWKGRGVTVSVRDCQRHSALQVTCVAEGAGTQPEETSVARDWATLLPHGIIRVHPGNLELILALR